MIDNERIKTAFFGLVGVSQTSTDFPKLDSDIVANSESIVLNDLHPFFSHENIFNCVNGLDRYATQEENVRAWSSTDAYIKGDLVKVSNKIFRALQAGTNHATTDALYWTETNLYSNYFRRKLEYAYVESVRQVIDKKIGYNAQGKTVVNNIVLYDGKGVSDQVEKRGRFVGYKISVLRPNMKFKLHKIAIQLSQAQELDIYIFQANNPEAISVQTIDFTTPFKMTEFTLEEVTFGSELEGNDYTIGYYEDDLEGYAVKRDIDLISPKVGCCNQLSYGYFQKYSPYVDIKPMYVNSDNLVDREQSWSYQEENIINGNNFGMNINFTVQCDVTDLLIQQKKLFKTLITQQLVVLVLKDLINSTRTNTMADNLRGLVLTNGTIQGFVKTEEDRLKNRLDAVSLDITSLDSVCLPNDRSRFKIRTGSM
jgi:hypothetical protein